MSTDDSRIDDRHGLAESLAVALSHARARGRRDVRREGTYSAIERSRQVDRSWQRSTSMASADLSRPARPTVVWSFVESGKSSAVTVGRTLFEEPARDPSKRIAIIVVRRTGRRRSCSSRSAATSRRRPSCTRSRPTCALTRRDRGTAARSRCSVRRSRKIRACKRSPHSRLASSGLASGPRDRRRRVVRLREHAHRRATQRAHRLVRREYRWPRRWRRQDRRARQRMASRGSDAQFLAARGWHSTRFESSTPTKTRDGRRAGHSRASPRGAPSSVDSRPRVSSTSSHGRTTAPAASTFPRSRPRCDEGRSASS